MKIPSDEWFTRLNREFRERNVEVQQRPFVAMKRYCAEFNVNALALNSTAAKRIFEWFTENTKRESHYLGPLFTGAFYYDATFWPVSIPIGFGTFKLTATDGLRTMPDRMKAELLTVHADVTRFMLSWADCIDYAYGFDDISKRPASSPFGLALLSNADKELRASVSLLLEQRPNSKSAMSSRMAVEIFLKAFLVLKAGTTEARLRELSHHLPNLVAECGRIAPNHDLLKIEEDLSIFPAIHDRYTGADMPSQFLWAAYEIALYTGAATIRSFTDRDMRSRIWRN